MNIICSDAEVILVKCFDCNSIYAWYAWLNLFLSSGHQVITGIEIIFS